MSFIRNRSPAVFRVPRSRETVSPLRRSFGSIVLEQKEIDFKFAIRVNISLEIEKKHVFLRDIALSKWAEGVKVYKFCKI